jgi:ATP-dependent Lon protease
MNRIFIPFLFFICSAIFSQTEIKISKDRYNFLIDSLTTEKSNLQIQKSVLLTRIDSLKQSIVKLNENIESARIKQLIKNYGKENGSRIAKGQVWKGMKEKMLEDSWGKPDKITKNREKWGLFTQWYYGEITYFFKNGEMIGWEQK